MDKNVLNPLWYYPDRKPWCQYVLDLITTLLIKDLGSVMEQYLDFQHEHSSNILLQDSQYSICQVKPCHLAYCAHAGIWLKTKDLAARLVHCEWSRNWTVEISRAIVTTWTVSEPVGTYKFDWNIVIHCSKDQPWPYSWKQIHLNHVACSKFPMSCIDSSWTSVFNFWPKSNRIAQTLIRYLQHCPTFLGSNPYCSQLLTTLLESVPIRDLCKLVHDFVGGPEQIWQQHPIRHVKTQCCTIGCKTYKLPWNRVWVGDCPDYWSSIDRILGCDSQCCFASRPMFVLQHYLPMHAQKYRISDWCHKALIRLDQVTWQPVSGSRSQVRRVQTLWTVWEFQTPVLVYNRQQDTAVCKSWSFFIRRQAKAETQQSFRNRTRVLPRDFNQIRIEQTFWNVFEDQGYDSITLAQLVLEHIIS